MRWLRLGFVGALLLVTAGSPAEARDRQVYIEDAGPDAGRFVASAGGGSGATIQQHDTVFWENRDQTTHNATGDDGSWSTGNIAPGAEGSRTFSTAGRFPYHCSIHPSMTGTLEVTPNAAPTTTPAVPPPPGATATTARRTATTARSTGTTVRGATTTTTVGFEALASTTTSELSSTTSTTGDIAIRDNGDGGSNTLAIAAVAVGIAALLGAGGYALYRLGASRT